MSTLCILELWYSFSVTETSAFRKSSVVKLEKYEGESKSKGKKHLTALTEVTVQFYISFYFIVPLQHNAFVILFN
jgi:hypothetical protein